MRTAGSDLWSVIHPISCDEDFDSKLVSDSTTSPGSQPYPFTS